MPLDLDYCRVQSISSGEPIAGSAVASTTLVVALEHEGGWGAKAVAESDLPSAAKARLLAWEDAIPGVRVQLIRRDNPTADRTLLIASTELGRARVVRRRLAHPDDIVGLDLPAIASSLHEGGSVAGMEELRRPQILVCTNGRRDRCCAKWGLPLYRALAQVASLDVWQTTHLGGHRFAATLLWLPEGICLGRLELDEVDDLVDAIERGEIHRLDRLRGRVCLSAPEQAAEVQWRRRCGRLRVDDLAGTAIRTAGPEAWEVVLRDAGGATHEISVSREPTGQTAQPSCGKPSAPVMAWHFAARSEC